MQSRREFFARLAVLCGAAAAVPVAAKAFSSAVIDNSKTPYQIKPTCVMFISDGGEPPKWRELCECGTPVITVKKMWPHDPNWQAFVKEMKDPTPLSFSFKLEPTS